MKAVLQRVASAQVAIDGSVTASIGQGLLILLGVMQGDTEKEAACLAEKIAGLRIFTDAQDKMNVSLLDVCGEALVVSNFTLGADCQRGRRPSFSMSAASVLAKPLYEHFVRCTQAAGVKHVATGTFGATMQVSLCNDGPVTLVLDTDVLCR